MAENEQATVPPAVAGKNPAAPLRTYEPSARVKEQIERTFTYHAPRQDQVPRYHVLRAEVRALAETFVRLVPDSRELSLALTKLEEAVMAANAGIARNE